MSLTSIAVSEVMTKDVKTVSPVNTVSDAIKIMAKYAISSVIIVDRGRPVGIFTEKDLIKTLAKNEEAIKVEVEKAMSTPIITVNNVTSLKTALEMMATKKINHLPVVEDGKLVGMISEKDIFRYILKHEGLLVEFLSETATLLPKSAIDKFGVEALARGVWPPPGGTG